MSGNLVRNDASHNAVTKRYVNTAWSDRVYTLSGQDIVKQFPGPSLPKLMAQFRFAFRFSYWCMLSPQPYTGTVPVLGRTVATLRPALARMPWRSAGHRRTHSLTQTLIVAL